MTKSTRHAPHPDPDVEAWIRRQLAKPGGHGPIGRKAAAVVSSVFGRGDRAQ